jgi:putative ABC transport system ATP-binding protein
MIEVKDARKFYSGEGSGVEALRGISLEIPAGQFVAVMGPSGCGKSTLLHVLGGLDRLTSGEIYLNGQPWHGRTEQDLTELRRKQVGIVFQFFNLLPTLTLEENVLLPALLQDRETPELKQRAARLLDEVGLSGRAGHQLHQLSGGEMQRGALARALLLEPPVLLADEPTGNLDSETSARVIRLFHEMGERHGTTIVMVTHSREVAAAADRLVEMRDGRIERDSLQEAVCASNS